MPRLLFVDDEIVDHDPGDFDAPESSEPSGNRTDETYAPNAKMGLTGYFIRDIEAAGFEVVTVNGVADALQALERSDTPFDIIVLDVMMPYTNGGTYSAERTAGGLRTGFVLAEEIHMKYPMLPVWVLSQIVPGDGTGINKATVDDLVARGIVVGVTCKLGCNTKEFASRLRESWEAR